MTWLSDEVVARLREPDFSGTRYRIVAEIARGGMGVVYEAEDLELQRRVAIKVMSDDNREPRLIAQLEHPGIVPVHDSGVLPDGRVFYAMKLVRGRMLHSDDNLRLFLRLCEAVAFAHSRGVVHCDLKLSNVMVGEFGEVLVMDWGIANTTAAGTRGYMSPEQERGDPVDSRTDVYSLGAMLRERAPLPRRLAAIAAKATAINPSDRYASASELADDVSRFLDDQPLAGVRESATDRALLWLSRNRALVGVLLAYVIMRLIVLIVVHR